MVNDPYLLCLEEEKAASSGKPLVSWGLVLPAAFNFQIVTSKDDFFK